MDRPNASVQAGSGREGSIHPDRNVENLLRSSSSCSSIINSQSFTHQVNDPFFFTPCIPFTPYVLVVHSFLHQQEIHIHHPHSLFPPFRTLRPLRTVSANSTSEALFAATHRRTPSFQKYCQSVHYWSITHFEIISQSPEVACMILIIWHTH